MNSDTGYATSEAAEGLIDTSTNRPYSHIYNAVAADLRRQGISQSKAAEMLGTSRQVITNQLSGRRLMGRKSAARWHDVFGYSIQYLMLGEGDLKESGIIVFHTDDLSKEAVNYEENLNFIKLFIEKLRQDTKDKDAVDSIAELVNGNVKKAFFLLDVVQKKNKKK